MYLTEQLMNEGSDRFWDGRFQAVVFDHDPETNEFVSGELRLAGIDTFVARTVEELTDILALRKIDMIVTDSQLTDIEDLMDEDMDLSRARPPVLTLNSILASVMNGRFKYDAVKILMAS